MYMDATRNSTGGDRRQHHSFRVGTNQAHGQAFLCFLILFQSIQSPVPPRTNAYIHTCPALKQCLIHCAFPKCWCARDVEDYRRHGEGTCDFACTGDAGTTCGGYYSFDLFELKGADDPPPPSNEEDYYLGCFADDKRDRVLEDKISAGDMTLEVKDPPTAAGAQTHPMIHTIIHVYYIHTYIHHAHFDIVANLTTDVDRCYAAVRIYLSGPVEFGWARFRTMKQTLIETPSIPTISDVLLAGVQPHRCARITAWRWTSRSSPFSGDKSE